MENIKAKFRKFFAPPFPVKIRENAGTEWKIKFGLAEYCNTFDRRLRRSDVRLKKTKGRQ